MTQRQRAIGGRFLWGALGIVLLGVVWELYKFLGPADGVVVGGLTILRSEERRVGKECPV